MKKIKSTICIAFLSIFLVGTVFAADTGGNGVFSLFSNMVSVVYRLAGIEENCRPRECQNCRPEQRDADGNCRPTEN